MNLLLRPQPRRAAFTIIEVMIALAASLLLMLGLTRAFKLIGDAITASQSELTMASSLREVTFRMRDEMHGITVPMTSPQSYRDGGGYFTYYEGPWTDATTTLVNGQTAPNYFPTSRYGDLDDYLAFTTRSEHGRPFSGTVPSGVIEAVRLADHVLKQGLNPGAFRTLGGQALSEYTSAMAHQPVTVFSEVAEVAYFLSPGWRRNPLGIPVGAIPGTTDGPQFVDVINDTGTAAPGDNIPDQLSLIRRLLLVRNDLNITMRDMALVNDTTPPAGAAATVRLVPFLSGGSVVPLSSIPRYSPGPWPAGAGSLPNSPNWLTGTARPHQWMDLSLSRGNSPADGTPTGVLKANSLADLTLPENRFGFVRMPAGVIGGLDSEFTSSMGLLALSGPHPFITAAQADDVTIQTGTFASQTGGQVAGTAPHPFSLVGFVRPEFSLADHWIPLGGGLGDAEPTFRGGSDVVATDVLSFDVQVLDPTAPVIVWRGPDGAFGRQPGAVAPALIPAETDNVVIEPSNASFRTAIQNFASGAYRIESRGGFVDHGYARLAGGTLGGLNPSRIPTATTPPLAPFFVSRFSGKNAAGTAFPPNWVESGRLVRFGTTNGSFYQPTIDTWTDYYDHDGFVQKKTPEDQANLDFVGSPTATGIRFRGWSTDTPIATGVGFVNVNPAARESHPPTDQMPAAVKVTVRIYDRSAGEVRQQTIIHHFRDRGR